MSKVATHQDQSVFDIAVQEYGSVEAVFDVLKANPGMRLDSIPSSGTILALEGDVIRQDIVDYYSKYNIKPATGSLPDLPVYTDLDMLQQILNLSLADGNHTFPGIELKNLNLNASVQLNYTGINSSDVQVKLEMSLDGVNYDDVPTSLYTLDNTKESHTWVLVGLITNYIRLNVTVNTATAGKLDELLIRL